MKELDLGFVIDPDMKEGSLYLASVEPSKIKCLNGLYLHKVCIDEGQVLVKIDNIELAKSE